ncbi:MAG: hypothetical protein HKN43_07945, partial [Rhodothermales bacterium]|nr:hypothetical protein [Rhodothermales bacterium]
MKTVFLLLLFVLAIGASPSAAQRQVVAPEAEYTEAFRLFNERLYDLAFTRFSEFRARYPDHVNSPDALFYEAEALL